MKVRVILIYAFQLGFSSEEDMYVVIVLFFFTAMKLGIKYNVMGIPHM